MIKVAEFRVFRQTLIGLRYLPFWVVGQVWVIGPILSLANPLFIFREDRRCLHDLLAGTKVVVA